jgi:NAD(P)-dependent dehydrogenase (short-subunit alcohol dehydrogenase family)
MHMATNHLDHFALTGMLFPLLLAADNARVVTVSSLAYCSGRLDFDDLDRDSRQYDRIKAYGDSKLANLLFTVQLQRMVESIGTSAISVAAHPGLKATERQQSIGIGGALAHWIASPVSAGVRSQLLAASEAFVRGGEFYRPRFGILGPPVLLSPKAEIYDSNLGEKLRTISEELTGVAYPR